MEANPPAVGAPKSKLRRWLKRIAWTVLSLLVALVLVRIVAGYVMERRFGARLDALRKAGEPITIGELAPPQVPAGENAAELYEQAFKKINGLPKETKDLFWHLSDKRETWSNEDLGQARKVLTKFDEALRLLREGARRPQCVYTADYNAPGYGWPVRRVANIAKSCQVLKFSCQVNAADGRANEAVEDALVMLKLARSDCGEAYMLSTLAGVKVTGMALKRFEELMSTINIPDSVLKEAQDILGDVNDRTEIVRAMKSERCDGISLQKMLMDDPLGLDRFLQMEPSYSRALLVFLSRPFLLKEALMYLDVMEKYVEIAGMDPLDARKEVAAVNNYIMKTKAWRNPLIGLKTPAYEGCLVCYDGGVARRTCAQTALALRLYRMRNGNYPDVLDQLTPAFLATMPLDPFTGKPLIYRREGQGFIVYSLGPNGVDDGGKEVKEDSNRSDIVWKCLR